MFTKIVLVVTLCFLGSGAVDDCAKSPDACVSTFDDNALLQRRVAVSMAEADNFTAENRGEASTLEHTLQRKGNIVQQAVNTGGNIVNSGANAVSQGAGAVAGVASQGANAVAGVASQGANAIAGVANDVMDSEVGDILKDVASVAESTVVAVKNKIVQDFGNLANFLVTHVEKAIDILASAFSCMRDLFDGAFDCATTWFNQGKNCLAGNGCQLSIGYPTCSSLTTEYMFGKSFTREIPLLSQKDNISTQQRKDGVYEAHGSGFGEQGQDSHKSKFMHETLVDFDSDDLAAPIEQNAGLSQIEEESGLIIGSWDSDHSDANANESNVVRSLKTSGSASLHAGLHMNINLDNTVVKATLKSELHFEGSIEVHASGSRVKEIPQTDITPPKRLFRKIIMVGKIPCEVMLSVKLVYSGSVEASGSVAAGVKVTQEVHQTNILEYNFEKLIDKPHYEFTAQTWDPTVEPTFSASGSLVATLNIGPVFTLSVNRAPFDWGFMPQIVATASAQLNSNLQCAAASATFEVTTNLAGSMGVGLPHIDPAAKAYEACMAMKETITANPAAQGLNCLSKAVLKFDVNSAMNDACHAMRSALPSLPAMRWDWTVGTAKLFSQDYAQQACTGTQAATTNRAVAKAGAGEPASLCDGGWQQGDGTGGSERYIGHAASFDDCVAMVKAHAQCASANGATMPTSRSGNCYCEFSMNGRNGASHWSSCKFSAPGDSRCVGGKFQLGDGTGGSERYIGYAANFDTCVTMVKDNAHCTSASGATMPTSGSGNCYCEFSMTGRNGASHWSSCKFSDYAATAVAAVRKGASAPVCNGGWQQGDGTGGSERYIGHAANFDTCVTMVKGNAHCTSANGATMPTSGSGNCYCEFSMTGRNSASYWSSCKFN